MTLAITSTAGSLTVTVLNASAMMSAAGCIRAQWNGAETSSSTARLAPRPRAIATARSTARASPDTTTCPGALSLAAWHLAFRRLLGDRHRRLVIEAEQRRHRAGADRGCPLHGAAAGLQQPRRVGEE